MRVESSSKKLFINNMHRFLHLNHYMCDYTLLTDLFKEGIFEGLHARVVKFACESFNERSVRRAV